MTEDYQNLMALYRTVILNKHAMAMLEWDRAVMMPEKGATARSEILGFLSTQAHAVLISDEISDRLQSAMAKAESLPAAEQADLKLMEHEVEQARALPSDLVGALSRQASICEYHWQAARQNADFDMVLPHAEKLLALKREETDILASNMNVESRYEALLDQFDPGRRTVEIDKIFAPLAEKLPELLAECVALQPERPPVLPKMAIADQQALGRQIAEDLGFDFSAGRLDVSVHPFSGGISDDVRMTARYEEEDFWSGLLAVIHETGHGLYDGGMPEKWRYAAIGQSFNIGMTGHEAMALFMEKQIALCPGFLSYFSRKTAEVTGLRIDPKTLRDKAHHVSRSFIRTEADEISYPLHIILRYRLEKLLINGDIEFKDVPRLWNAEMQSLLGITPKNDSMGCLQDVHWYRGGYGYFPSYSLGAMAAAQYFSQLEKDIPEIDQDIEQGDFKAVYQWLSANIYVHGCRYRAEDLLEKVTGRRLSSDHYLTYLHNRYGGA